MHSLNRERIDARLSDDGRAWFRRAFDECAPGRVTSAADPVPVWEQRFAAAGRHCGPEHAADVRVALLTRARPGAAELARLYWHGTRGERLAVLIALTPLAPPPEAGLPLIEDALRSNDTDLIAAAAGHYGTGHLPPHAWRHAVLKCLFTGVPLTAMHALERRARGDAELGRMLTDYAAERTAAGRDIPADLTRVLALTSSPKE